jgi:outer membrane cobalamin receptor
VSEHTLRLSLSPSYARRSGDERIQADPEERDPLTANRQLFTLVSGLEYELNLLGDRLSNVAFVKDYIYRADSEEPLPGGIFRDRDTHRHRVGVGDSLRFQVLPWLYAKASYEYATRLPRPDEVFGDGVLVVDNLELDPEVSHNANVGPRVELWDPATGEWIVDVNGFLRDSDRLVVLLGNDRTSSYQNVYRARSLGIESALSWLSPGRYVALDGSLTWQDVRNASSSGTFGDFNGDRIPNRPYLFASWGAHLRFANLPGPDDTLEPFYDGRYVHSFFRGWESQGLREFKQVVDAQVTHSAGLSWTLDRYVWRSTLTFEVDNFTDAKLFDNFGVQRPGRAFYLKLTGEL